jgi:hypothetical protein
MDHKVFSIEDFKPGITAPPFHPNCRTTMAPHIEDKEAEKMDGDSIDTIPDDMTYGEWYNQYVRPKVEQAKKDAEVAAEANNSLKNADEDGIMSVAGKQIMPDAVLPKGHIITMDESNKIINKIIEDVKKQIEDAPKNISEGQQSKHIAGTKEYNDYVKRLSDAGQYGPSRIYGDIDYAEKLIEKYSGKGVPIIIKNKWQNSERITAVEFIGTVVNNLTGDEQETNRFKIHYSKKGVHIVPDYKKKADE